MSTECVKNNNSCSELYERNVFYCPEDILNVCKAEDEEQKRRCADKEGENHKRVLANNLSDVFGQTLHATWFQRGSTFVLSLLGGVRSAVVHKASDISNTVSDKAGELGHKAALRISATADDIGIKAQAKAHEVSNTISNKAGEVGLKAQEKAHLLSDSIAHKAGETASSVSSQAQAAASNIKGKSLERAHSVSSLAQEKAHEATSWFSELTHEYTQRLKDAVVSTAFYKKLGSFVSFFLLIITPPWILSFCDDPVQTGHTNMTFALLEEETERAFRMNDASEIYRIENALKVCALFKSLHPELNCCDRDVCFNTRIMEEAERSRRICEDKCDKAPITNAKAVCDIICQKFSAGEQIVPKKAEIKVEFVAEEAKKPIAAAM